MFSNQSRSTIKFKNGESNKKHSTIFPSKTKHYTVFFTDIKKIKMRRAVMTFVLFFLEDIERQNTFRNRAKRNLIDGENDAKHSQVKQIHHETLRRYSVQKT